MLVLKVGKWAIVLLFFVSCAEHQEQEEANVAEADSQEELIAETSIITCPHCDFEKEETLPTEICLITYTCSNCEKVLHPKQGDCCVFCSWGDHKCPSKQ